MSSTATPLVSVVMPVYNGVEFIADAIRSVLTQTCQRFDFHIANNCSKDRTLAVAQEFAAFSSCADESSATTASGISPPWATVSAYPRLALHGVYRLADLFFNPRSGTPLHAPAAPLKPVSK